MPKIGYKHSEEIRRKISLRTRQAMSSPLLKAKLRLLAGNGNGFKKGTYYPKKNYRITEEHKKKISETMKARGIMPPADAKRPCGKNHHNWGGGVTKMPGYQNIYSRRHALRKREALGQHSFSEWENLKKKYGNTCPSCLKIEPEIKLTEDHIIPLSKGGTNNIDNIQPLCRRCNSKKCNKEVVYQIPISVTNEGLTAYE